MNITAIANEYIGSAQAIKERVDELSEMVKSKKYSDQKKLEDRIVVLNAEHSYLLRTAGYLSAYYHKEKPVSRIEVEFN